MLKILCFFYGNKESEGDMIRNLFWLAHFGCSVESWSGMKLEMEKKASWERPGWEIVVIQTKIYGKRWTWGHWREMIRNESLLKSRVGQIDCGDEREEGVKSGLQIFNLGI